MGSLATWGTAPLAPFAPLVSTAVGIVVAALAIEFGVVLAIEFEFGLEI